MSGRPIGPCPECGKMAIITLIPSRIETKSTHPDHCGNYGTYDVVTVRTMTWNCSNKTCEQSEGKPNLAEYHERRCKKASEELMEELELQLKHRDKVSEEGKRKEYVDPVVLLKVQFDLGLEKESDNIKYVDPAFLMDQPFDLEDCEDPA